MTGDQRIIEEAEVFVRSTLKDAEKGHDWWHIERVARNARHIGETERVNMFIVILGVLFHDIADSKFHEGDEEVGPAIAREFLKERGVSEEVISHIEKIIRHVSFKGNLEGQRWMSPELAVVQDADRLDALGAIGIARAFTYGGFKNRVLYDPARAPQANMTSAAYKKHEGTTVNHFYEKLLLLKDLMNTETGKRIAEGRHAFMEQYLEQFHAEWNGER